MKRLFFGLFAAGVALGTSAFTSATPKPTVDTFYYVLTSAGTYVRTATVPVGSKCLQDETPKCWISYSVDKGDEFPSNAIPSQNKLGESATRGIYNR